MTRILGIDPGLRRTGWGVIEQRGSGLSYLSCGTVAPKASLPLAERLLVLHRGLEEVVTLWQPGAAAIEETFVNVNAASTLKLGNARGALLLSLSLLGLPVAEYSATHVKKSIVGVGRAEKGQVGMMVRTLLPACDATAEDALDALAIAICHTHQGQLNRIVGAVSA